MDFLERLDLLIQKAGINKHKLAMESGIPYSTIDGFYKKGYQNVKLSTLKRLCYYFNVTLDYLIEGNSVAVLEYDEMQLIGFFRDLNKEGKEEAVKHIVLLAESNQYKKDNQPVAMEAGA
jgi:transcriptional regulator with XRE-family HTH domain